MRILVRRVLRILTMRCFLPRNFAACAASSGSAAFTRPAMAGTFLGLVVCVLLCPASSAMADLYQWTDENGVKHFSNTPPPGMGDMPEQVTTRREEETPAGAEPPPEPERRPALSAAGEKPIYTRPSRKGDEEVMFRPHADKKVVMYTAGNCRDCDKARNFFKRHSVACTEINISFSRSARDEYRALGGQGVPLILVGGDKVSGLNIPRLQKLLDF